MEHTEFTTMNTCYQTHLKSISLLAAVRDMNGHGKKQGNKQIPWLM